MGKEKEGFWEKALDYTQTALDVVGMIPVVGEVADLANAGISLGRGNYLEAAISFVSMIPGIGAAGPLMKALNKLPPSVLKNLDKFLEALGDILKKLDLKKILDGASGILDKLLNFITKKNDKLGKGLRKIFCEKLGWACFAAGTLVYSKQGYMPIEEIKVGDLVYAKDPVTGAQGLKEVRQVFERKVRKLIHIELEEVSLSSTLEHPFWVYGKGFIKAEDLEVGDALVRYEAYESTTFKTEKIKSIEISYHEDPVTVYNFEVEAWHSYFVSEQGIWVHNAQCQAPKQKGKVATKKGNPKREPPKIKRDKDGKIVKKKGKLERSTKENGNPSNRVYDPTKPMSQSNYPNPDPDFTVPPVRYEPKTIEEVERMRKGKGPTTKATHGDRNIEAHHRGQKSVDKSEGILDELEEHTHRRGGNHTRHTEPSELTPAERAKEIKEHWKKRGSEYILPGEGI